MCIVLLVAGLMAAGPPDPKPVNPAADIARSDAPALPPGEALAHYNEMRTKTPDTAAAQWKLALWCEKNGLPAEAYVHYGAVVRLEPSRDAAWRKLGYKK